MLKIATGPRLIVYVVYLLFLGVAFLVSTIFLSHPQYMVSLILAFLLGAMVPAIMIFKSKIDLVEPIYWFSLMYYFVFIGTLYYILTDFADSQHLLVIAKLRSKLLSEALMLFIVGFTFYCAGYWWIVPEVVQAKPIQFTWDSRVPGWLIRTGGIGCALIGFMNFLYVSHKYPYGAIQFLLDFGIRSHRFELMTEEVTTVGYHFLYAAVFMWLYLLKREGKLSFRFKECYLFAGLFFFSVLMMLSAGRTFNFLSYALTFSYLLYVFTPRYENNLKHVIYFFMLIFFGIVMFFFRIMSSEMFNNRLVLSLDSVGSSLATFIDGIMFWLIGKGNIPDIAIVMNLIDSQKGLNVPLYGKSFIGWVQEFVPSSSENSYQNIARTLGYAWFGSDNGLPPTMIGEMLVNFGYCFIPIGLFIVGVLTASLYKFFRRKSNFFLYLIYLSLLFRFFFIWSKGETSNIIGAIHLFFPTIFVFSILYFVSYSARRT